VSAHGRLHLHASYHPPDERSRVADAQPGPSPDITPAGGGAPGVRHTRERMTRETALGTALLAYAGANGLTGLFMLSFPRALWVSIGGAEGESVGNAYASTRFAGAALAALAVAALLVMRKPAHQSTLVTVLAIEATLVAAATVLNGVIDEVPTDGWFTWLIALGSVALAGLMWWARVVARKVLKAG
jgi:hypothetical protein